MQSWNLNKFIAQYGISRTATIWDVSRQAVEKAVQNNRDIQIILIGDVYEVRESKILKRIRRGEI